MWTVLREEAISLKEIIFCKNYYCIDQWAHCNNYLEYAKNKKPI